MKVYTPNREERAFLYQEAQDLEPLMKNLGSLSVLIEETAQKGRKGAVESRYRVTFVVAPESVGMKVQASHDNLFAATISAKTETLRQLNAIVNAMPQDKEGTAPNVTLVRELLH